MNHYSPSYSIILRLRYPDLPGFLGRVASTIGEADGSIGSVDHRPDRKGRNHPRHRRQRPRRRTRRAIVERVRADPGRDRRARGRSDVPACTKAARSRSRSKTPVKTRDDLSMVYTPGVARVCRAIEADPEASFALTIRENTVAVVSDGSAVLGLGNIGAEGRHAGDGRQVHAVQGVRRRGRLSDLPRHAGRRRDRADVRLSGADVRRHQPGRHLLAALRRDRAAADRRSWIFPCSTTISTARPSWSWRRCRTP